MAKVAQKRAVEGKKAAKGRPRGTMNGEDYRAVVFNSARDGNLRRLNIFLEDRSPDWLFGCLTAAPSRTPPIVIAARNGHLGVVRYLLTKGADVSVRGTVAFDGEVIPGAPALWAAAAAGHLDVVRCLVEEGGADINQTTNSNSSPLRGACYDGHFRIVEYLVDKGADIELANRHGHTPLMIAAFKMRTDVVQFLLQRGADPLKSSAKGNTAMHDAAEAGSEAIVRMLLNAGAKNVPDDFGVTPMMCAALAGHERVVRLLADVADPQHTRDAMKARSYDFFLLHAFFPVLRFVMILYFRGKENAFHLQLYGATLVDKKMDLGAAILIWNEALTYGRPLGGAKPIEVYENLVEVDSFSDMRNVVGDPDAIRMQALIMRERILGGFHHETHYFIRYRGAVFCDLGQVDRCFQLWMHALKLQQNHLCALHPSTMSTIGAFLDTFMLTVNEGIINANMDVGARPPPFSRTNVLHVFNATVDELQRYSGGDVRIRTEDTLEEVEDEEKCTDFLMLACLQFILLVSRLRPIENKAPEDDLLEEDSFFASALLETVHRLVRICDELSMFPLHASCQDTDKPVTARFPSSFVITMLIRAGVDVNSKDRSGNTALHTLLECDKPRMSIVKLLLERGAKLLARNANDETCLEIINRKMPLSLAQLRLGRYITLSGLAANALQRCSIPRDFLSIVPKDLLPILELY
ncbi:unnamed protein product [Toxocara canis]|uniref:ANK_REP_REGION domain-containing protein n=1 Tax=Toxocara canis TaxID=6265 RepID=A0A183UKY8_TOXCA|nr:unnamed protein product [Toxocara canis]